MNFLELCDYMATLEMIENINPEDQHTNELPVIRTDATVRKAVF